MAPRCTIKSVLYELYDVSDGLNVNVAGIPHAATDNDIYNGYFIPQGAICFDNLLLVRWHVLGATIITNTWWILTNRLTHNVFIANYSRRAFTRNEAKYPNPEEFKPERFFDTDGKLNDDTVSFAFGAGRRICQSLAEFYDASWCSWFWPWHHTGVGRYIADASVWSAMVSILAIFDIKKCKDEQGNDINVMPKFTAGITS